MMIDLMDDIYEGNTYGICEVDCDLITGAIYETLRQVENQVEGGDE